MGTITLAIDGRLSCRHRWFIELASEESVFIIPGVLNWLGPPAAAAGVRLGSSRVRRGQISALPDWRSTLRDAEKFGSKTELKQKRFLHRSSCLSSCLPIDSLLPSGLPKCMTLENSRGWSFTIKQLPCMIITISVHPYEQLFIFNLSIW